MFWSISTNRNEGADPTIVWDKLKGKQVFQLPEIWDGTVSAADGPPSVRLVCISDTHGRHQGVVVPPGDVLLHSGDFSDIGAQKQVESFRDWLLHQKALGGFAHVVVIAGNHETTFDEPYFSRTGKGRFHRASPTLTAPAVKALLADAEGITYLEDSFVDLVVRERDNQRVRVYGSPWTPEFCNWAFNARRGPEISKVWSRIPASCSAGPDRGVDVLLTHGPPLGRGDETGVGSRFPQRTGCADLLTAVQKRVKPLVHVFGHIHEGYGLSSDGATCFVNASTCNLRYQPFNPAVVMDLVYDKKDRSLAVGPRSAASAATDKEAAPLYPSRAVMVRSRVHNWSREQVSKWLKTQQRPEKGRTCVASRTDFSVGARVIVDESRAAIIQSAEEEGTFEVGYEDDDSEEANVTAPRLRLAAEQPKRQFDPKMAASLELLKERLGGETGSLRAETSSASGTDSMPASVPLSSSPPQPHPNPPAPPPAPEAAPTEAPAPAPAGGGSAEAPGEGGRGGGVGGNSGGGEADAELLSKKSITELERLAMDGKRLLEIGQGDANKDELMMISTIERASIVRAIRHLQISDLPGPYSYSYSG